MYIIRYKYEDDQWYTMEFHSREMFFKNYEYMAQSPSYKLIQVFKHVNIKEV